MGSRSLLGLLAIGALFGASSAGCNKIPGLAKKDAGSEGSGSGGILSFLGGGSFEGEITMKVSGRGKSGAPKTMVMGIKSPKLRIDAQGGVPTDTPNPMLAKGASFIVDPPAKKGYALITAEKKAIVIDFDKAKALRGLAVPGRPGAPAAPAVPSDPPTILKSAAKSVVAGYTCDEWKIVTKTSHADVCVAEGITWIDLTDLGMLAPEVALAAAAGEANRFPLRVVTFDQQGESARMEATKVDKKTLPDTQFAVPPDYQVVDIAALLGGLPQAGAGRLPPGVPPGVVPPKTH